jgi:predicted transcriptional regulator
MERRVYLKRIFKGRDAVYSALKVLHAKYVEISVAKGHKKRTMSVAKILEEGIGNDERIRIYREIARQEKLGVTAKKAISAMMRGTYAARMSGAKAETWIRYYNDWKRHRVPPDSVDRTVDRTGLTVDRTVDKKLKSSTCEQILSLLAKNPQTTQEELARTLGLSIRGIEYAIGTLKKAKRLRKVGGKRFGRWEIL